jgi:hypothetical protein
MKTLAAALAALSLTFAGAASAPAAATADRCAPGAAADAATRLFGAGTELARTDDVGGLRTALVLEPYIAPGTRHRLIAVPGGWCDAETAFNRAWRANGRAVGDGAAMAAAYARLAAAPYFDETTVVAQHDAGAVHVLSTHALTNGVEARWVVATDAEGVRAARWAETAYAVRPFRAQWEGLTATAGAQERYARGAGGLLAAERGLPAANGAFDPAAQVSFTGADGFTVVVGLGDTRQGVDIGQDTGNSRLDILRMTRDVLAENYQDFHDWGFRADWGPAQTWLGVLHSPVAAPAPARTGYVSIDDATSAYCQACVFIADDFQIHFVSEVRPFLEALGYAYGAASDRDVLADVLGHEMFHNWQNNATKPAASKRSVPASYSEGTARFQQTLHRYGGIEHQPTTLLYADDANGCNGLAGSPPDATLAKGPFESAAYAACNFWMGWYGAEGLPALVKLVTTGMVYDTARTDWTNTTKVLGGIVTATGKPYSRSAAAWAAALITGKGLTWNDPLRPASTAYDWSTWLERWTPAALAVGASGTRTLANGGVMAYLVAGDAFVPSISAGATLAVLRDGPAGPQVSFPAAGETVPAAAEGESVYVIGVLPKGGTQATTIRLAAAA